MASGKPIIGTKVGGIKIQVADGETGFLVQVGDIETTAAKIIKLLTNPALQKKMSQKSLERVEKKDSIIN